MIIKNGLVFCEDAKFKALDIEFENGKITKIADANTLIGDEIFDAKGEIVAPGYVDIHTHGVVGEDFCDGNADGIGKMLEYYGKNGVTTVLGTTMAFDEEILSDIFDVLNPFFDKETGGAILRGINMEGPFFNKEKKGAQAEKYIVSPDISMFDNLNAKINNKIKLVDVAPELDGSIDFIKHAKSKNCTVSIAHTNAKYEQAMIAFENGADHVTHLFNAMPIFTHRAPGVVGAAADSDAFVEMICDGIHLHPCVIRTCFKLFTDEKICLISDSMRACGMPNGEYSLGGQKVFMTDGKATLANGTIAGSATNLAQCVRNVVSFGIPVESAIKSATITPATSVNMQNEVGVIKVGASADIQILSKELNPLHVWVKGNKI